MSRRIACIRIPLRTAAPAPAPEDGARLAGALLSAAPRVVPVAGRARAYWADVAGMEGHGGEAAVALALHRAAAAAGWSARVGVAGCCCAAAAATRERGAPTRVVPPGRERAYLRAVPLAFLPLSPPLRQALALLGLVRCGDLAALPPAEVELRLGREGLGAWRLSRGDDPRWPFRPPPPGTASAEADFEPPVEGIEPLRFVLAGLIARVTGSLAARQRIPARLLLALRLEDGSEDVREVRPARPTAESRVLADLCRRAAEALPLAARLRGVALSAAEEGVARADQLDAFSAPAPDPGALHGGLLPVFGRWGECALSGAVLRGAHLPAERAAWEALGVDGIAALAAVDPQEEGTAPSRDPAFRNVLPLALRRLEAPLPLRVREDADGRPVEVERPLLPNVLCDPGMRGFPPEVWKTRGEGPERISGSWWARAEAREYWRVESPQGWLAMLYREVRTGGWYLEGWYD
jgi:protein ImuB